MTEIPGHAGEPEETPASLTGTVVRGAGLSGAGYAFAQTLNLAVYVVLARLLSPHEFGVYAAGTVLLGFALLVTDSGLVSAVIQRRDRLEEAANTALVATTLNGVVLSLVALASAPLIGHFFDASEVTAIAAAMSGMIFLRTLSSVPDALLQRRFSFLRRIAVEPAQVVAFGAASIIAASAGLGVWSLVVGQYTGTAVDVILSWALVRWRPHLRQATMGMWRELVAFGRHVFVSTSLLKVGEQADALIVGRFLGTAALGQFRYGQRIAVTPYRALVAGASYVLFPAFSRIAHDDRRHHAALLRSLRWMCLLAVPAGLLLIPLGEPTAVLVFGERWRDAGHVATAMCLFTGAGMIASLLAEALKARGRPDRLVFIYGANSALMVIAMLVTAPLGLTQVGIGVSIAAVLAAGYAIWIASSTLGLPTRPLWQAIWPPAVAALAMAAVVFGLEAVLDAEAHAVGVGLAFLAGEIGVAVGVYLGILRLIAPEISNDFFTTAKAMRRRLPSRRSRSKTATK
jgi:O-antigen/teichoic acid export membrane protein